MNARPKSTSDTQIIESHIVRNHFSCHSQQTQRDTHIDTTWTTRCTTRPILFLDECLHFCNLPWTFVGNSIAFQSNSSPPIYRQSKQTIANYAMRTITINNLRSWNFPRWHHRLTNIWRIFDWLERTNRIAHLRGQSQQNIQIEDNRSSTNNRHMNEWFDIEST